MAVTSPDRYALGRDTTVSLFFRQKTLAGGVYTYSSTYNVGFEICISEGSVTLDTDNIDIPSNCQAGWRIKLPGLKSGTVSGTGYIAATAGVSTFTSDGKYNLLNYLGDTCQVVVEAESVNQGLVTFAVSPADNNGANGYFKTGSVTINPDDAVKVSFSVELSGAQNAMGFVAAADLA